MISKNLTKLSRDPKHAEWVKAYMSLIEELRKYIMEYHTTGLKWNANVCHCNIFADEIEADYMTSLYDL